MCTLTYKPLREGYLFTTNRDEHIARSMVTFPEISNLNGIPIIFPKEPIHGGTWIACDGNMSICLLNGAFQRHERKAHYRKSRGLILLDAFKYKNPTDYVVSYSLDEIEPFTMVMLVHYPNHQLFELIWDGKEKHFRELDKNTSMLWASSTLYNSEEILRRKNHFLPWSLNKEEMTPKMIMDFHAGLLQETNPNWLQIGDKLRTLSVTSIFKNQTWLKMSHHDLLNNIISSYSMGIEEQ